MFPDNIFTAPGNATSWYKVQGPETTYRQFQATETLLERLWFSLDIEKVSMSYPVSIDFFNI